MKRWRSRSRVCVQSARVAALALCSLSCLVSLGACKKDGAADAPIQAPGGDDWVDIGQGCLTSELEVGRDGPAGKRMPFLLVLNQSMATVSMTPVTSDMQITCKDGEVEVVSHDEGRFMLSASVYQTEPGIEGDAALRQIASETVAGAPEDEPWDFEIIQAEQGPVLLGVGELVEPGGPPLYLVLALSMRTIVDDLAVVETFAFISNQPFDAAGEAEAKAVATVVVDAFTFSPDHIWGPGWEDQI